MSDNNTYKLQNIKKPFVEYHVNSWLEAVRLKKYLEKHEQVITRIVEIFHP